MHSSPLCGCTCMRRDRTEPFFASCFCVSIFSLFFPVLPSRPFVSPPLVFVIFIFSFIRPAFFSSSS
jgi:hypothetical protein